MTEFSAVPAWTPYTVLKWGAEQANRYTDIMTAAFTELAQSPKTAPACDHIRPDYRRLRVERHMIYIRIRHTELQSFASYTTGWMHLAICESNNREFYVLMRISN